MLESFFNLLVQHNYPRLRCQTKNRYVQTVPDGKSLCPDPPRWKVPMSRLSCVHRAFKSPHVETFVPSKLLISRLSCFPKENLCAPKLIICAFMSRLSCVQKTLCPDFRAFKNAYVQTFVCSIPKTVRCKINILCVLVEAILLTKEFMSRLYCVQNGLCPNFWVFQTKFLAPKFTIVIKNYYFLLFLFLFFPCPYTELYE